MATEQSNRAGVPKQQKLVSWKTIASYFGCDERTAKRWERERRLPVHRAPGKRSAVFAYSWELDSWLVGSTQNLRAGTLEGATDPNETVPEISNGVLAETMAAPPSGPAAPAQRGTLSDWKTPGLTIAVALILVAPAFWTRTNPRNAPLQTPITQPSTAPVERAPSKDAEDLYLRGHYFWNLRTADGLSKALDAYTQAIVLDPSYAGAYAGLAKTYDLIPQFGRADLRDSFKKAETASDRAIALNPNLSDAHAAKAFALFYWDWDIAGSDAEFQRAIALDPNSALTHQWYASTLDCRDDGPATLREIGVARRLNPASASIATDAMLFEAEFGNYDEGVKGLKDIEQTQPTLSTPASFLMELDFARGDFSAYVAEARQYALITHSPEDAALAEAVARGWSQGSRNGLLRALLRFRKVSFDRTAKLNYSADTAYRIAKYLLLMKRPKEALPWFREALNRHDIGLLDLEDCPWAKPLGRDPGYAALFADIRHQERGTPAHPAMVRASLLLPQ